MVPEYEFVRIDAGGGGADSEVAVERAVVEGGHGGHQAAHEGVLGAEAARLGRQQRVLPLQAVAFLLQLHVLGSVHNIRETICGQFLGSGQVLGAVLRIHEILVRIWIPASIPLTNGSGSCYFVIDL